MYNGWQATVQTATGALLPLAEITVRVGGPSGSLATIYSNRTGTAKSNPFFASGEALAQFWAQPGTYYIIGALDGQTTDGWYVDIPPEIFADRGEIVSSCAAGWRPKPGLAYAVSNLSYYGTSGATDIPDIPGALPVEPRSPLHYGWTGTGTVSDQKLGNLAFQRAGRVVLDVPGNYKFNNSNPIADAYPTGSEVNCDWWAVRRAWYIGRNDVTFEIGAGVNFTAEDNSDCHFIQIGQPSITVRNSSNTTIGTTTHVYCDNVRVIGQLPDIDMNATGQTPATDTDYHPAGVWVQNGASNVHVSGLYIHDGPYYGIGFEGMGGETEAGFTDCVICGNVLENFPADGIDCKDFGTNSTALHIHSNRITNVGSSDVFLSEQAGIDVRGGSLVENNEVRYTDTFDEERVGIRSQRSSSLAESENPTTIRNNLIIGNGQGTAEVPTIGIRVIGTNVSTSENTVRDFTRAVFVTAPNFAANQDQYYDCDVGIRLGNDTLSGLQSNNAIIGDCDLTRCDIGILFDATQRASVGNCAITGGSVGYEVRSGASGVRIVGGSNTATTALDRNGSGSLEIRSVSGFVTETELIAAFDLDSTSVQTLTIPHGLTFTPLENEVSLHLVYDATTQTDIAFAFPPFISAAPDATNIYVKVKLATASATLSANMRVRVKIKSF